MHMRKQKKDMSILGWVEMLGVWFNVCCDLGFFCFDMSQSLSLL